MDAVAQPQPARKRASLGRDHLNLAEFPISVLKRVQPVDDAGKKVDTIVYRSERYDHIARRMMPQTVTLSTSSKLGLPTPADDTVVLGLLYLGKEVNFSTDYVRFTPSRLFAVLNWAPNSRSYDRLRQVLRRLKALTITYENAWYTAEGKHYEKEFATGIIATYELVREVDGPKTSREPRCWVRWNPDFYESLQSGSLKTLNLPQVLALSDVARRIYRYLDKHFWYQEEHEFDLRNFAFGHVGLSPTYSTGKIKEKLQPAITELEKINFIDPVEGPTRYRKIKAGEWKIRFRKAKETKQSEQAALPLSVELELTSRGVTRAIARDLVANYSVERIRQKLELLDFHSTTPDQTAPKRPAGWLVKAIQDDYQAPPGFKTKAQREADAAARQQKEADKVRQEENDQQRRDRERQDREALFARWQPVWDDMTETEQKRLWDTVWKGVDFFTYPRHRDKVIALEKCFQELESRYRSANT